MNKISVVVPVYNVVPYLERAVKSIQEQTYRNIEILLVDNGSTDGSSELVDELADKDSRIVPLHVASKGVSFARLEGVRASSGEWIGFVDGDDYIEPDMYEHLLNNALKYDAQISHCGYQMVFPSRVDYYYNTGRLVQQDNLTGLKDLLDGSFIEPGLCNKLFRKTLFHSLLHDDVMDLSIKNNEDLLMNYYLFKESLKNVYEDFCPYHYMVRNNSTSSSLSINKLEDPIKVQKIILEDTGNNGVLQSYLIKKLAWLYYIGASKKCKFDKEINNCIRNCRKELKAINPTIQKGNYSREFKIKCAICSFSPAVFRVSQKVFAIKNGTNKIYEVR